MKRRNSTRKIEAFISVAFWVVMIALAITMALSFCKAIKARQLEAELRDLPVIVPITMTVELKPVEVILPVTGEEVKEPAPAVVEPEIVEAEPVAEEALQPVEVDPPYPVPLDAELQSYIVQLCEQYQIEPELVLAVIEHESDFNAAASGDNGNSHGLMQIQPRWHQERMARLECSDLFDPWQNVTVGVDILAELLAEHETVSMALMVYNAGLSGANAYWFSHGIYSNEYSQSVLSIAEGLKGA